MFYSELKKEMERSLCWLVNCVLSDANLHKGKGDKFSYRSSRLKAEHNGAEEMWVARVVCFLYFKMFTCVSYGRMCQPSENSPSIPLVLALSTKEVPSSEL